MKRDTKPVDKLPVKIRTKLSPKGHKSIYLDIYDKGIRKKEYLKLYLLPEKTEEAKEANKRTMQLAETIRAERVIALQAKKSSFYIPERKELKMPFVDYMAMEISKMEKLRTPNYIRRYKSGESWVRRYDSQTTVEGVNKNWVLGFIRFLSTTPGKYGKLLNQNTAHEYLIYVANILNNAVREGILSSNPTKQLSTSDRPKKYESKRDYLTDAEINKLIAVPSPKKYNNIRNAFLFSCYCGLRYSDIVQLKWKNIVMCDNSIAIDKKLQKTQTMIHLPLNKKAISFLPERTKPNDLVFKLPKSLVTTEAYIKIWSEFAEINKHVTFHTSRHTFAVNILAKGGDIYTLSKLLGHKRVTTTQIYADILDENKKKTMDLLDK